MEETILQIKNLKVDFFPGRKSEPVHAVRNVSMALEKGRITALVGESGSGKSVTCKSICCLIDPPGKIRSGEIWFQGRDLLAMKEKERMKIYGDDIFMVFQDCMSSLNPIVRIKKQMLELIRLHKKMNRAKAYEACIQAMSSVHLPYPEHIMEKYPFELSGGMCQRVMLAMALLVHPQLLIADEPTTSLDLTIQAAVLEEFKMLKDKGTSILMVTHDLGIVAQMADYVYVMNNGEVVEQGEVLDLFDCPQHPYTKELIAGSKTI